MKEKMDNSTIIETSVTYFQQWIEHLDRRSRRKQKTCTTIDQGWRVEASCAEPRSCWGFFSKGNREPFKMVLKRFLIISLAPTCQKE